LRSQITVSTMLTHQIVSLDNCNKKICMNIVNFL